MKTIITLLTCSFYFLPLNVSSQDLIKQGFITLNNGDHLAGEIRSKNWSKTPQKILFRGNSQAQYTEYDINDVQYFEASGSKFLRAEVWVDRRPVDYQLDSDMILPEYSIRLEKVTVFLKCLVLGTKYSLFELIDDTKSHFYLKDNTGIIKLLEYKVISRSQQVIAIDNQFRQTLTEVSICGNYERVLIDEIQASSYDAMSLSHIVESINNSDGSILSRYSAERSSEHLGFFAGIAAGITATMAFRNTDLKSGIGTVTGAIGGIDIITGYTNNGGNTSFRFDVMIARMTYAVNASNPNKRRLHESVQYGIIPSIQMRFPIFTLDKFECHIGGGFKTPIHISEKQKINPWKDSYLKERFPWVAITVGGQLDFEIKKKWEIGMASYQAPSVNFGGNFNEPIHYYLWLARRF